MTLFKITRAVALLFTVLHRRSCFLDLTFPGLTYTATQSESGGRVFSLLWCVTSNLCDWIIKNWRYLNCNEFRVYHSTSWAYDTGVNLYRFPLAMDETSHTLGGRKISRNMLTSNITCSVFLALCERNPLLIVEFPSHWPHKELSLICLNKLLRKRSRRQWFETLPRLLWHQCKTHKQF